MKKDYEIINELLEQELLNDEKQEQKQQLKSNTQVCEEESYNYEPGYKMPQAFQCGGIRNAGKYLRVDTDGYVRPLAGQGGEGGYEPDFATIELNDEDALTVVDYISATSAQEMVDNLEDSLKQWCEDTFCLESFAVELDERVEDLEEELTVLSPKVERALLTPIATPTSTELVGISTTKEQLRVKLGSGLSYDTETDTLSATGGGEPDTYIKEIYNTNSGINWKDQDGAIGSLFLKTINSQSIIGSGNITIEGQGLTLVYDLSVGTHGEITINNDNYYQTILDYYEDTEKYPLVFVVVHIPQQPDIIAPATIYKTTNALQIRGENRTYVPTQIRSQVITITTDSTTQSANLTEASGLNSGTARIASVEIGDNRIAFTNQDSRVDTFEVDIPQVYWAQLPMSEEDSMSIMQWGERVFYLKTVLDPILNSKQDKLVNHYVRFTAYSGQFKVNMIIKAPSGDPLLDLSDIFANIENLQSINVMDTQEDRVIFVEDITPSAELFKIVDRTGSETLISDSDIDSSSWYDWELVSPENKTGEK